MIVGEALQPGLSLLGEKHTGAGADEGFPEGEGTAEQEGVGIGSEFDDVAVGLGAPCGFGLAEPGEVGLGGVEGEAHGLAGLQEGVLA